MIYSKSVKIGCGAAICGPNKIYTFCNFAAGQYDWRNPYQRGPSCSSCPNSCQNNLCQCNLICQNRGTLNLDLCSCTCPAGFNGTVCETQI